MAHRSADGDDSAGGGLMQLFWFVSRAAGLVSLVLLTTTVVLGITGKVRVALPGLPRFVLAHLHRNLSLLTVLFLGVHVSTAVIDPFAGIRWVDTVVPFLSGYRTFWLGLGVVALELLAALVLTSVLRARIGLRAWRAVHWAAYACWPVAVVHGLGMGGPDSRTPWVLVLTVGCVALVAGALVRRMFGDRADEHGFVEAGRR